MYRTRPLRGLPTNLEKAIEEDQVYIPSELLVGGTSFLLLSSPDIPASEIEDTSFSNGNCEILKVEIQTIKQAVIIVISTPLGESSSRAKSAEVARFPFQWQNRNSDLHRMFSLLLDLVADIDLEQIVDKFARKKASSPLRHAI